MPSLSKAAKPDSWPKRNTSRRKIFPPQLLQIEQGHGRIEWRGLKVIAITPEQMGFLANGLKFSDYSSEALSQAIRKAIVLFEYPGLIDHFRNNGMRADFSWTNAAAEYLRSYQEGVRSHSHSIGKVL